MAGKPGRRAIYLALACVGVTALAGGVVTLGVLNMVKPISFTTLMPYFVAGIVAVAGAVMLSLALRLLESAG